MGDEPHDERAMSAVGADFYDVFAIGERSWALVIGDVCGSGPDAAALTSIARHTVRAAARHGEGAADVMAWLNEAVGNSNRHLFCTACYATLTADDERWRLTSPAAGHPRPTPRGPPASTPWGGPALITNMNSARRPVSIGRRARQAVRGQRLSQYPEPLICWSEC